MQKLSKRQEEVLEAISQYIEKNNYPPAYRDLAAMLGLKSPSTVSNLLNSLKKKGYVNWEEGQPRTLHIIITAS
ncbi:transcriptional regulator [Cytobacillus praedii]|uniref:Transcriptional regulator n=1 Tax=Cytobacillus praedii TaxID=1742358 RepID=A0A4R1AX85_9BACI|nr:transcriptional regulator [Cytobacillus praedii]TCJ04483.1 transcriptional regulator [Cytobacillus praedii]